MNPSRMNDHGRVQAMRKVRRLAGTGFTTHEQY
jgi:hypothetical protein